MDAGPGGGKGRDTSYAIVTVYQLVAKLRAFPLLEDASADLVL